MRFSNVPTITTDQDTLRTRTILVLGQLTTSQTENLSSALSKRVHSLTVVGLPGIRQKQKGAFSLIVEGSVRKESRFVFPTPRSHYWLFPLYYVLGFFAILRYVLASGRKYDAIIGISTFYAVVSLFFRSIGISKKSIYYCLDYYRLSKVSFPQRLFVYVFRKLDRTCAVKCDSTWNVTNEIVRERGMRGRNESIVPTTYPSRLLLLGQSSKKKRWSIAFAGVVGYLSGLQVLVDAMPEILQALPNTHVEIIGDGDYLPLLKRRVIELGLQRFFTFHGFVEDDEEFLRLLAECTIGVAPYAPVDGSYVWAADPGKPKLYAFLGLPAIMTKWPVSLRMEEVGAGITIDYDSSQMAEAVIRLLSDTPALEGYVAKAREYAAAFVAEKIYPEALSQFFLNPH
jgi:glycosyltransferase involved in cell wall biosynthesis